jgi:hypothetical protein
MGMLRRMKDMKDMVNAAPGMIQQAQEMSAQAQQMAMAQQAAMQAQMAQEDAHNGWNDRIRRNPAVAQRFNLLYRAS